MAHTWAAALLAMATISLILVSGLNIFGLFSLHLPVTSLSLGPLDMYCDEGDPECKRNE